MKLMKCIFKIFIYFSSYFKFFIIFSYSECTPGRTLKDKEMVQIYLRKGDC